MQNNTMNTRVSSTQLQKSDASNMIRAQYESPSLTQISSLPQSNPLSEDDVSHLYSFCYFHYICMHPYVAYNIERVTPCLSGTYMPLPLACFA